jgi:hypothetical protein
VQILEISCAVRYWMTLRDKEGTAILNMTHKITLYGEIAFEQRVDMLEDREGKIDYIEVAVY